MPNHFLTQFDLHKRLYNNVLDGFIDTETNRFPFGNKNINHVKYLAGHFLNSQYGLAIFAGLKPEVKWNDLFAGMGLSEAKDNFNYPSIQENTDEWNSLNEITRKALSRLTSEDLAVPPPSPFEHVADSTGEMWAFFNHHIAYRFGQIGILRKAFGKEAMSYE